MHFLCDQFTYWLLDSSKQNSLLQLSWGKVQECFIKGNLYLLYDPAILLLDIFLRDMYVITCDRLLMVSLLIGTKEQAR